MKKTYINPTTEIVKVETAQLMALSISDTLYNGTDDILSDDDNFDLWDALKD